MMNTFQKFVFLSFTIALVVDEVIVEQANVDILTSRHGNITSPGYPGNFTHRDYKTWILPHPTYSHNSILMITFLEMHLNFIYKKYRRKFVMGDLTIQGLNVALMEDGSCLILENSKPCQIKNSGIYQNCILWNLNMNATTVKNLTIKLEANGFIEHMNDKKFKIVYEYVECSKPETTAEGINEPNNILLALTIILGAVTVIAIICLLRSKVKNHLHRAGQNCQTEEMNPELRSEVFVYENMETTRQYEVVGPKQDEPESNLAGNAAGYTKMNPDLSKIEHIDYLEKNQKILSVKKSNATAIVKNKAVSSVTNLELNPGIVSKCMNVNEEKENAGFIDSDANSNASGNTDPPMYSVVNKKSDTGITSPGGLASGVHGLAKEQHYDDLGQINVAIEEDDRHVDDIYSVATEFHRNDNHGAQEVMENPYDFADRP